MTWNDLAVQSAIKQTCAFKSNTFDTYINQMQSDEIMDL